MGNPERSKALKCLIAAAILLVIGVIAVLAFRSRSDGLVAFTILAVGPTSVSLLVWGVKWLQIDSMRQQEEDALRRGDTYRAARIKQERERYRGEGPWFR